MPREKESYRDNLERLMAQVPPARKSSHSQRFPSTQEWATER